MQSDNRLLDDLARVATGAAGAFSGVRTELEQVVRQRMERLLADADMVPRDEFEAIRAVAVKAREEQEALEHRVAALEAEVAALKTPAPERKAPPKKPSRKPAAKASKPG